MSSAVLCADSKIMFLPVKTCSYVIFIFVGHGAKCPWLRSCVLLAHCGMGSGVWGTGGEQPCSMSADDARGICVPQPSFVTHLHHVRGNTGYWDIRLLGHRPSLISPHGRLVPFGPHSASQPHFPPPWFEALLRHFLHALHGPTQVYSGLFLSPGSSPVVIWHENPVKDNSTSNVIHVIKDCWYHC